MGHEEDFFLFDCKHLKPLLNIQNEHKSSSDFIQHQMSLKLPSDRSFFKYKLKSDDEWFTVEKFIKSLRNVFLIFFFSTINLEKGTLTQRVQLSSY